jgi:hypothetical protein
MERALLEAGAEESMTRTHGLGVWAAGPLAVLLSVMACERGAPSSAPPPRDTSSADPVQVGTTVDARPGALAVPDARPATQRQTVVRAAWGDGPLELGHRRPSEAMPEGPMALALDSRGRIHVLDQVNSRVVIFDGGQAAEHVALSGDSYYQDIAIDAQDRIVVLDRLRAGAVQVLDDAGAVAQTIPITGKGLAEGGASTALFVVDDGIYIEAEHQHLVRVADAAGAPDPGRALLAGRPSLDGKMIFRASLSGPSSIALAGLPEGGAGWQARVDFPMNVANVRALESDAAGRVYLAAFLIRERAVEPFDVEEQKQVVVVLSPTGEETARIEIVAPTTPDEQFRPIRVGTDGAIYQLVCNDDGATVERFVP